MQSDQIFDFGIVRRLRHLSLHCEGIDEEPNRVLQDFATFLDGFRLPTASHMDSLELSVTLEEDTNYAISILQDPSQLHLWSAFNAVLTRLCSEAQLLSKTLSITYYIRGPESRRLLQDTCLTASVESMVKNTLTAFSCSLNGEVKVHFSAFA